MLTQTTLCNLEAGTRLIVQGQYMHEFMMNKKKDSVAFSANEVDSKSEYFHPQSCMHTEFPAAESRR